MPDFNFVYLAIPRGRFWVRWIDHVARGVTRASRTFHIVLSPLDEAEQIASTHRRTFEKGERLGPIRQSSRPVLVRRMDVGLLPNFAVGDIFDDQRLMRSPYDAEAVASVCDIGREGETLDLTFDFPDGSADLRSWSLGEQHPGPYPEWHSSNSAGSVLSRVTYPGLLSRGSQCLVLTSTRQEVVIVPAAELVRAFMFPTSEIVRRFFAKPPSMALKDLVELPVQAPENSGHFRVDLQPGLPFWTSAHLAVLMEEHNPVGARAAEQLWLSQSTADPDLPPRDPKLGASLDAVGGPASAIAAVLPFDVRTLRLRAKCFRIWDDRYLVAKIVGGTWPGPVPIECGRVVPAPDQGGVPPPCHVRQPARDVIGQEMHLEGGAGPDAGAVAVRAESVAWERLPAPVRARLPRVANSRRGPLRGGATPADGFAAGDGPGDQARADVRHGQVERGLGRFGEVIAMLDGLGQAGDISHYDILPAPTADRRRQADGWLDLWTLRRWNTTDASRRRPRTLMVVAVLLEPGRVVHWLEIEQRGSDSHRAVLVSLPSKSGENDLLKIVDRIGPEAGARSVPRGVAEDGTKVVHYRHAYRGGARRALNPDSALKALIDC